MYEGLLGPAWLSLPESVRSAHRPGRSRGTMRVTWGRGSLARVAARLLRLPRPAAEVAVHLEVRPIAEGRLWIREIGGKTLSSGQRVAGGLLLEEFGPLLCAFRLRAAVGGPPDGRRHELGELRYEQEFAAVRLFGAWLRLPAWMSPKVRGRVCGAGVDARTEVEIAAPLLGTILSYAGITRPITEVRARGACSTP